jgi:hypothetical protein
MAAATHHASEVFGFPKALVLFLYNVGAVQWATGLSGLNRSVPPLPDKDSRSLARSCIARESGDQGPGQGLGKLALRCRRGDGQLAHIPVGSLFPAAVRPIVTGLGGYPLLGPAPGISILFVGAIYLSKVQGKCFNCRASDHRVAQCHNPTKCWVSQRFGHISYGCPSRRSASCSS